MKYREIYLVSLISKYIPGLRPNYLKRFQMLSILICDNPGRGSLIFIIPRADKKSCKNTLGRNLKNHWRAD